MLGSAFNTHPIGLHLHVSPYFLFLQSLKVANGESFKLFGSFLYTHIGEHNPVHMHDFLDSQDDKAFLHLLFLRDHLGRKDLSIMLVWHLG